MFFEDNILAAIEWLQASLKEYRSGEFEQSKEKLDTALGFAYQERIQIATAFEENIQAAIDWLQASLKEYRSGEFEQSKIILESALSFANQASEIIEKTILDIHTQAQRDRQSKENK